MKTYIQPETKVVSIRVAHVMATSTIGLDKTGSVAAGSVDARDNNSWDIWGSGDYEED